MTTRKTAQPPTDDSATEVLPTLVLPTEPLNKPTRIDDNTEITDITDITEDEPVDRANLVRRHPIASVIAAAAIAIVLACGLTAWGVGTAVRSSLTSSPQQTSSQRTPASTASTATTARGLRALVRSGQLTGYRGTIATIDGSVWTVTTRKGTTETVTVDSSTRYGTRAAPATAGDFSTGATVLIVATKPDGAKPATAIRVVTPVS